MNRFWKAVLLTTLVAGTLDIVAAHVHQFIRTGIFPQRIFYAIAGGAIGLEKAYSGGAAVLLLGIFIHYFIAFSFTLLFFLAYPVVKKLSQHKILNGVLYAVFVQCVMTFIVLPLTALPHRPFVFSDTLVAALILMVAFALPISLMTEKYYRQAFDT